MIIIPNGSIFIVHHRLIFDKHLPMHYFHEDVAVEFEGRLGVIIDKIQSKVNRQIYRCLIGKNDVALGKGWIKIVEHDMLP